MLTDQLDRLDNGPAGSTHSREDTSSNAGNQRLDNSVSFSNTGNTGNSPQSAEAEVIASKVSQKVFRLKLTVVTVLMIATAMVAVAFYVTTNDSETSGFEETFYDLSLIHI